MRVYILFTSKSLGEAEGFYNKWKKNNSLISGDFIEIVFDSQLKVFKVVLKVKLYGGFG